jgi:hypothetical protein
MTISVDPNSNNTAATISWLPMKDKIAGFD